MKFNENNEFAYFLGLMYSDGCVCKTTQKRHIIHFGSIDYELAYNVSKFFNINFSIEHKPKYKKKIFYTAHQSNKELFDILESYGCVRNKTFLCQPPKIKEELIPAFLLGFFDGDGCISVNRSINSWKASIGTSSFCLFGFIKEFLNKNNIIYYEYERMTSANNKFYDFSCTGMMARHFLNILYSSVDNFSPLSRKFEKYKILLNENLVPPKYQKWEDEIILQNSPEEASKIINSHTKNIGWKRSPNNVKQRKKNFLNKKNVDK